MRPTSSLPWRPRRSLEEHRSQAEHEIRRMFIAPLRRQQLSVDTPRRSLASPLSLNREESFYLLSMALFALFAEKTRA